MARRPQLELFNPTVAKAEPRRGRPPKKGALLSHRARPAVSPSHPHHVTVRMRKGTWNLRSQRAFARIESALLGVKGREGFRVVHYSVQGNHVHMLAEGDDRRAFSNGMRALLIRMAKQLNIMMEAEGPRFADRYHERVLTSPRQVRIVLKYVLANHAKHVGGAVVDPFSSGPWFRGWAEGVVLPRWAPCTGPPTASPDSWLLKGGWRRAGGPIG